MSPYNTLRDELVEMDEKYYKLEAECHRSLLQIMHVTESLASLHAIHPKSKGTYVTIAMTTDQLDELLAQHKPLQSKFDQLSAQRNKLQKQMNKAISRLVDSANSAVRNSVMPPHIWRSATTATNTQRHDNHTNKRNPQELSLRTTTKRNHDEATSSTSSIEQVRRARRRVDSDDEDSYPEVLPDIIETIVPDPDQLYCSKCDRELPSDMFSDVQRRKGQSGAGVAVCLQHAQMYTQARKVPDPYISSDDEDSEAEEVSDDGTSDDEEKIKKRDKKQAAKRLTTMATTRPKPRPQRPKRQIKKPNKLMYGRR